MNKKRLHIAYVILNFVAIFKSWRTLLPVVIGLGSIEDKSKIFLVAGGLVVLALVYNFFSYVNTYYSLEEDSIIYNSGLFNKESKIINYANIQNIDTTQNFAYQIFGLVSLDINILGETVKIAPIKRAEANLIISKVNNTEEIHREKIEDNILRLSIKDLALLSLLKSRVIVTFFVIFAFIQELFELIKDTISIDKYININNLTLEFNLQNLILALFVFFIVFIISFVRSFIKYQNYTLRNMEDKLILSYGLFNKVALVVRKERIQKVSIEKNWKHRLLGFASLSIVTTSTTFEMNGIENNKSILEIIPIAREEFIVEFLKNILQIDVETYEKEDFTRISDIGKKIILRRNILISIFLIISANLLMIFTPFIDYVKSINFNVVYVFVGFNIVFVVLATLSFYTKIYNIKKSGIALADDMIIRKGTFVFTDITDYLKPVKVGGITLIGSIFLKSNNLCHIEINSLGTNSDLGIKYFDKNYFDKLNNYFYEREDR